MMADAKARAVLLEWAESGGFAAVHGAAASNEAIVDDLLKYLRERCLTIIRDRVAQVLREYPRSCDGTD